MTDLSTGPTYRSPDRSKCRNCEKEITWAEYSYVHDHNGMADCGVIFLKSSQQDETFDDIGILINPMMLIEHQYVNLRAEPVEWDEYPKEWDRAAECATKLLFPSGEPMITGSTSEVVAATCDLWHEKVRKLQRIIALANSQLAANFGGLRNFEMISASRELSTECAEAIRVGGKLNQQAVS